MDISNPTFEERSQVDETRCRLENVLSSVIPSFAKSKCLPDRHDLRLVLPRYDRVFWLLQEPSRMSQPSVNDLDLFLYVNAHPLP
ncbi:hypothetical protein Tco_0633729 [Tanacetum coccineum]